MEALREIHARLGATFASPGAETAVLRYGDPAGEARAARIGCGLVDRSGRGKLCVAGADRVTFLQGMVTNDVNALAPGGGCYAAILTPKGKLVTDLRLGLREDEVLLDVEADRTAVAREFLERHVISEDVTIEDVSARFALFGVYGPSAATVIEAALARRPDGTAEHRHQAWTACGTTVTAIAARATGDEGFDLLVPSAVAANVFEALVERGAAPGLRPIGWDALEILRVEAGIPRYGADMDEDTILLEAGIEDRAVSFAKGCYVGQEVIARATYRGHVNRRLVGLSFDGLGLPDRGAELFAPDASGAVVGRITSAASSPALDRVVGLGYVRREHADPGRALADGSGRRVVVAARPLWRRSA